MAIHLLRDYQNQVLSGHTPDQIPWLLAIFCRRVLQYTHVGNTNFDLDSSTYLKASGESSPNRAGINFGVGAYFEVSIPVGVRVVSVSDVGRMLVLRSTANPRHNSGIFLITGVNTAANRYVIDYRSPEFPPAEAADSMSWWLYERDGTYPTNRTTPNSNTGGYRSYGASCTCSRVILQSPHATGWQVRICLEHELDWRGGFVAGGSTVTNMATATPGLGGNSIGDFSVGGDHLHTAQWWDSNDVNRAGQVPFVGMAASFFTLGVVEQYRISMAGDDEGHGVYCVIRRPFGPIPFGVYSHWQFQFGLPENEPSPIPAKVSRRLFVMGNSSYSNSSQVSIACVANSFHYHGRTQGFNGQPVTCNIASWSRIETNAAFSLNDNNGNPMFHSSGGDNPYTNATDLLPLDLVAGMGENWYAQSNNRVNQFEPRIMGTLPFIRAGRSNLPYFALTADPGKSWMHLPYGTYMVWGGPAVIP